MDQQTYASAGVNVTRAELFVERLKTMARRKGHDSMWTAAGGYAAVYPVSPDRGIAMTTDGVGTKLLVAKQLAKYDTIGIDLVAMCANDLICVGAKPALFLDYFATGLLKDTVADNIIKGIITGCDQAGMILVGGETAEMPGVYNEDDYDLAGFALGDVTQERLITGKDIRPGQKLIGIASSGIHSNGLSLARKILAEKADWETLLKPTLIYATCVNELLDQHHAAVKGIAHITGGGWRNLFRLNATVGYHIQNALPVPETFEIIAKQVPQQQMYETFNMGMGLCLITDQETNSLVKLFRASGFTAQEVGYVTDSPETLTIENSAVVLKG